MLFPRVPDAVSQAEGNTAGHAIASVQRPLRGLRYWHVPTLLVGKPGDLQPDHLPSILEVSQLWRQGRVEGEHVANAVALQTVADQTHALRELALEETLKILHIVVLPDKQSEALQPIPGKREIQGPPPSIGV